MPTADIAAAVAGAGPPDDPVPFRFPASIRHRYEHLTGWPAGLLDRPAPRPATDHK